ncbi:sodium:dicarboxylate symporter [Bacillus sp. AFS015802]|uniref:YesK family protein n=1 Tax=Bacillus sp. AFS015802 TaxID=2033486 RepID=UPI000BF6E3BE|nr:YesK family protein [Bacillus sp. AFS015802]PFA63061.1 sodium:dicarboxylate symporter [Bacillus sp. AFS015802]
MLYLEGWMPIILLFLSTACLIVVMARYTGNYIVFSLSAMLGCISLGIILYSIFLVGGWEGMAIGFYAIAAFLGLSIGTAISPFIKKKRTGS